MAVVLAAYLNVAETAIYIGITERQLRDLVYRKAIPYTKVGRLLRFKQADLDRWLDSHTVPAESA